MVGIKGAFGALAGHVEHRGHYIYLTRIPGEGGAVERCNCSIRNAAGGAEVIRLEVPGDSSPDGGATAALVVAKASIDALLQRLAAT